jgi:hypothetical protein
MMVRLLCSLLLAAPLMAQDPVVKEVKGFVVSMDETKLVVSNIRVGGAGQTFTMPAPKDGSKPSWVAADPATASGGDKPKMVMMTTGDDKSPLTLTELAFAKGAFKPADFPAGTEIVASYREVEGKKSLQKLEAVKKP